MTKTAAPSGAPQAGLRAGHWLLIGMVLVILAALGWVVAHRGDHSAPPAATATSVPGSVTPGESGAVCLPKIVESGFSVTGHSVNYAVIARSDCPRATYNNALSVQVFDPAGHPVAGQDEQQPDLLVLLPGQQIGGAGRFGMTTVSAVGRIVVSFTASSPAPISAFASWPTSIRVVDLVVGKPDARRWTNVAGRVVTEPVGVGLCEPQASLIVRDTSGKIIYGQQGSPQAGRVSFDLTMPPGADPSRISVFVALGQPGLNAFDPVSSAACR